MLLLLLGLAMAQSGADQDGPKRRNVVRKQPTPVVTNEIRLVDAAGKTRLLLSIQSGLPIVQLLSEDGTPGLSASLDAAGHGSMKLHNSAARGPDAAIEIDDKGAHVKIDRSGGSSAYLFLNNAGESGAVLIDNHGKRRINMLVKEDGSSAIERFDDRRTVLP
jgi:hypothetical protein